MKKLRLHPEKQVRRVRTVLLFALAYFLFMGFCFGVWLALLYHENLYVKDFVGFAEESYSQTGHLDPGGTWVNTSCVLCDETGAIVDSKIEGLWTMDHQKMAEPYAKRLFRGEPDVFSIGFYRRDRFLRSAVIVVTGRLVPNENGPGSLALLIIRSAAAIDIPFFLLMCANVIYIMAVAMYLVISRKDRENEAFQRSYVSNISHELKSPIASILALTESLSSGVVSDDAAREKYYVSINREARMLQRTVDGILSLSRTQGGKVDFSVSKCTAAEIVRAVADKYSVLCEDMDITLVLPENLSSVQQLNTNAERIVQILSIFMDNAIKFSEPGGSIELTVRERMDACEFSVRDHGLGIAEKDLPHIFERFYMSDKSHNTRGSGLGLSIAKETADHLGETIRVETERGKGSVFSITAAYA